MNPFSLTFGKEPISLIAREQQKNEVIEGFTAENPEFQVCMITGVRGSGKTVLMTTIANELTQEKDWISIELNPERDMLTALAAELANKDELRQIFKDAKINLSFLGIGFEIDGVPPVTDVSTAINNMLQSLTKRGKKVLITIDEAVSNKDMRIFVSEFQILLRKKYNIFLLMTGLYDNIYELQNEKSLTFLYRAPKIELKPLNINMIANKYKEIFNLSDLQSSEMAKLTFGYSYAFQVLGYLCFKQNKLYTDVISDYDLYLEEYSYNKIWSELSKQDRLILYSMANTSTDKVEDIRKYCNIESNKFSVYRDRLIKKGVVESTAYGRLSFTLPRFSEYILRNMPQE